MADPTAKELNTYDFNCSKNSNSIMLLLLINLVAQNLFVRITVFILKHMVKKQILGSFFTHQVTYPCASDKSRHPKLLQQCKHNAFNSVIQSHCTFIENLFIMCVCLFVYVCVYVQIKVFKIILFMITNRRILIVV